MLESVDMALSLHSEKKGDKSGRTMTKLRQTRSESQQDRSVCCFTNRVITKQRNQIGIIQQFLQAPAG